MDTLGRKYDVDFEAVRRIAAAALRRNRMCPDARLRVNTAPCDFGTCTCDAAACDIAAAVVFGDVPPSSERVD